MKLFKLLFAAALLSIGFTSCNEESNKGEIATKPIAENASSAAGDVTKTADQKKQEAKEAQAKKAADNPSANLPKSAIKFDELEHYFGTIDEGDKVEHIFSFTNVGNEDLILEKCKGSCGCTVPTCPNEPIPPGGKGEIKVVFNSQNKKNHQEKKVTVTANTDPLQTILKIIADVTPAEGDADAKK